MIKVTPNPPATDEPASRVQSARNKKIDEAATRALDFYLKPKPKISEAGSSLLHNCPKQDIPTLPRLSPVGASLLAIAIHQTNTQ
jgi:hypothetical protein